MKRIFIKSTFRNHNFIHLIGYFNQYLEPEYGRRLKVIHHRKIYDKKYSIARFFDKIWMVLHRLYPYDLVISDFYSAPVYKMGKKTMYIFHGALTKHHPSIKGLEDKKRLTYHRNLRRDTDFIITLHESDKNFYLRHPKLEDLPLPKYLPLGLPRNDLLFNQKYVDESNHEIRNTFGLTGKKTILYAPTFRDYKTESFLKITQNDIEKLNSMLKQHNCMLIYRPHYFSGIINIEFLKEQSNIITIDSKKEGDTQKLLCACDTLITDYSSIFVDFLILKRPVLFFPFDLAFYTTNNGLTIDFTKKQDIPGEQVFTWDELVTKIPGLLKDEISTDYSLTVSRYYTYFDGYASKRIWDLILREFYDHK